MTALWLIVLCGVLALLYAVWATRSVLASDPGSARMQEIAAAVREGAQAYLKRQYTTIGMVGVVIFLILAYFLGSSVAVGFLIGAVLSGAAGFIGMNVSVRANVRTAQAAIGSLANGLELAFKAGAITGLLVAGLALLGVTLYFGFLIGTRHMAPDDRTVIDALVALGFGASLISIFARLGGGIFYIPSNVKFEEGPYGNVVNYLTQVMVGTTNNNATPLNTLSDPYPGGFSTPPGRNPVYQKVLLGGSNRR